MRFRKLTLLLLGVALLGLAFAAWGYFGAVADPVVRRAEVQVPALRGSAPLKLLLISDIHVAGPDMPPERLARIVGRINALAPDAILIAGDFVGDRNVATRHYGTAETVAPLAALRARLGVFAVLGNHDHWRDEAEVGSALKRIGLRILDNDAIRAGPLAIGGLDDAFTGEDDVRATLRKMNAVGGVPILLSHSPDPFATLPESVPLMLAGHTHCGQIRLPLIGPIATESAYGDRYACGLMREDDRTLVVSAGLGTSVLPLRIGTAPDMWLITLTGDARRR